MFQKQETALHLACEYVDYLEVVKQLIQLGAKTSITDKVYLVLVCWNDKYEIRGGLLQLHVYIT